MALAWHGMAWPDWSRPWHEILHDWNARAVQFVEQYSVKHWSIRCLEMHWKLARYANLPPDPWLGPAGDIRVLVAHETPGTR